MRSPLPSKSRFFQYQAYGLSLRSCIRCPELTATNQEPDVRIAYRRLPKRLRQASAAGVCYQAARGRLLLSISHVARYLVSKGNQILIDRQAEAEDKDVRLFLITAALGALMHLRGLLPLRASAVEVGGRAVLFLGPSAAGKSTLAGAFHQLGYRVLADHITVVSIAKDGMPWATPGYPRLRLWADVLKVLGIDTKKAVCFTMSAAAQELQSPLS